MKLDENLDRVLSRSAELSELIATHDDPGSAGYTAMVKEYADIAPLVEVIGELRAVEQELAEVTALATDPDSDAEMKALAESEISY